MNDEPRDSLSLTFLHSNQSQIDFSFLSNETEYAIVRQLSIRYAIKRKIVSMIILILIWNLFGWGPFQKFHEGINSLRNCDAYITENRLWKIDLDFFLNSIEYDRGDSFPSDFFPCVQNRKENCRHDLNNHDPFTWKEIKIHPDCDAPLCAD